MSLFRAFFRFGPIVLACAILGLAVRPARAQVEWTSVPPVTTANLWGVCQGGGQFVAVGEHGTILTSPDGLTWTPRVSGTTAWLTAVAYGYRHYMAVGADRTTLISSDAITWTPVAYPPGSSTDRLNTIHFVHRGFYAYGEHNSAVSLELPLRIDSRPGSGSLAQAPWWRDFATGRGQWVIVGEAGVALLTEGVAVLPSESPKVNLPAGTRSLGGVVFDHDTFTAVGTGGVVIASGDGLSWSAQSSGTTMDLQAITAFNNSLIAVGTGGTVLTQATPGAWTKRTVPTGELLLAVAAGESTAIAVGGSGTILRTTAMPSAPTIITPPAALTETLGGAASFVVRTSGSLPLRYQWSRDGVALPGETRAELIRPGLTSADGGGYTVTIANDVGSVTSESATLSLLPAPRAVVDATFHADDSLPLGALSLNGGLLPGQGRPTALLSLPGGGLLVAALTSLPSNAVTATIFKLSSTGAIDRSWQSPFFPSVSDNTSLINQLIIQPDGKILVGGNFGPSEEGAPASLVRLNSNGTRDRTFAPTPDATGSMVSSLALQPDGKILIANNRTTPLRLLPDGSRDPGFQPSPLPGEPLPPFSDLRPWYASGVSLSADGKIYVGFSVNLTVTNIAHRAACTVVRLLPGGATDTAFASPRAVGSTLALRALDDGGVGFAAWGFDSSNASVFNAYRYQADGAPYPGYNSVFLPAGYTAAFYSDGRLIGQGANQAAITRYTALGRIDDSFTGGIGHPTAFAMDSANRLYVAGAFDSYDGPPVRGIARLADVPNEARNAPRILSFSATPSTASVGEIVTVRAAVVGSGPLIYEWSGPAQLTQLPAAQRQSPVVSFPIGVDGSYVVQLTVRNHRGEATSGRFEFTIEPEAPEVVDQAPRVSAQSGRELSLVPRINPGAGRLDVEWRHDGQMINRAWYDLIDGTGILISPVTLADAGNYTFTARNALGEAVTTNIVVTVDDSSRLSNLSTRGYVGASDQSIVAGFVITGRGTRRVLVRGIGPGLGAFGVSQFLADPELTVFGPNGLIRHADNWADSDGAASNLSAVFKEVGAFPLTPGSKDAVDILTISPGLYTVQLSGKPGQTGTGLIEVYEYDNNAARLLNISTRLLVTPAAPAITGVSIRGPVAKRVLLRAVGPALGGFGVANALPNPRLELKDATGATVARNDDWETNNDRSAVQQAAQGSGAFPLSPGSRDATLLITLAPGNYTALVDSVDGNSGVTLVEVYEVP